MWQAEYRIEKSRIARSFAQAAASYDAYASLQRSIAENLLKSLTADSGVERVLDLGSGTGFCTDKLNELFPRAEIISLDIAEEMLRYARNRHRNQELAEHFICADAENLPLLDKSVDVIFSSLSIQWCQNYNRLFAELKRLLRPGGRLRISSFGPGTLEELKLAWQKVDRFVHVNQFRSDSFLLNELNSQGFEDAQIQNETRRVHYPDFNTLARELKAIGAHNMNAGRDRGLSGRGKISRLKKVFEEGFCENKGIPVTYQVQYLLAGSGN